MNVAGTELTLAERFRSALDACDQAYARGDATPVVTEARPRLEPSHPPPPLPTAPLLQQANCQQASSATALVAPPPPTQSGSTLRTIAIVAGVIVLAIGAWFVRKRLVEPMFYGRRGAAPEREDAPPPLAAPQGGKSASKGGGRTACWGGGGGSAKGSGRNSWHEQGPLHYNESEPRSRRGSTPRVTFEELPSEPDPAPAGRAHAQPPRGGSAPRPTAGDPAERADLEAQRLVAARQNALRALEELAGQETGSDEDDAEDDPNFVPL